MEKDRVLRELNITVWLFAVMSVILLIFGSLGWIDSRRSRLEAATAQSNSYQLAVGMATTSAQRDEAQGQARVALARQLSTQAQLLFATEDSQRMTAVLLATESMRLFPSADAAQILTDNELAYPVSFMQHDNSVNFVAFSPNGKYVVSMGSHDNTVRVWEIETGKEIVRITHDYGAWAAAISPDGKYVASGGGDTTARVWEIDTGKEISRMVHGGLVMSVAFSPDGKNVVSGSSDGTARVWEARTGREIARVKGSYAIFSPDGKYIASGRSFWNAMTGEEVNHFDSDIVAYSPDGKYVVSKKCDKVEPSHACGEGSIHILDVETGKEISRMVHQGGISTASFSPGGNYIVSGSFDKTLRVWEISTGKEIFRMLHSDYVMSATFSPDGKYILSGSRDGVVNVWDAKTGKGIARMNHCDGQSVAFSPDGKYMASGCGFFARVWKIDKKNEIARMELADRISSLVVSTDGKYIASGSGGDDTLRVWDIGSGEEVFHKAFGKGVSSIAFSPDGKRVVTGGYDYSVRVQDARSGHGIVSMLHDDFVYSVAFSPDGKYVASGSKDHTARVWDVMTGKEIARITHEGDVPIVTFSPDGKYMVSAGCNKLESSNTCVQDSARVWETFTGREISRMTHDYQVSAVAFSPDGRYVLSSGDTTARVWEFDTGKEIARMTHEAVVRSAEFSFDGKYVVSSGHTVVVWEAETGREIFKTTGMFSAKLSPDGKYLIAIDTQEYNIHIWDIAANQEIIRVAHDIFPRFVAFSPDGKYAISSDDHVTRIWIYRPEDLIADACSRVTQNLTRAEWQQYIGDVLPYQAVCPDPLIESEQVPLIPLLTPSHVPTFIPTLADTPPITTNTASSINTPSPTATTVPAKESPSITATPVPTTSPVPDEIIDEMGIPMRLVPAGEFTMGNSADDIAAECAKHGPGNSCESVSFLNAEPVHTVFLDSYYMDKYEVSNAAYRACVNAGMCDSLVTNSSYTRPSYYGIPEFDNYPVIQMEWYMAKAYCEWRGARLSTEAEWEKAARGEDGRLYPWGNSFDGSLANLCDSNCPIESAVKSDNDGYGDTAPVDSFSNGVSPYGIYNLAGNVSEWVSDWYGDSYYIDSPVLNPTGPADGRARIIRGSSWYSPAYLIAHVSRRGGAEPGDWRDILGFRCARSTPYP